ncbi:MAG: carbohydrate ABC transporter permease [Anaerolineae bacterium]
MEQVPFTERIARRLRTSLPFWLILPTILVLLVIQVYPAVYTVWLSVHEREPTGWKPVGLYNFKRLFDMSLFSESIGHTFVFLVGYVSLTLIIAFLTAYLLSQKIRLTGLYLTLLFLPWVLANIIVGLIFRLLVIPDYGLLSGLLQNPNLFPPEGISVLTDSAPRPWIGDFPFPPSPAMLYLILASTWRALPFITLLLLAAIQTIPREVIECSRIDGANRWQIIRHITLPLILPTLVVAIFNLTLSGVNGVGMIFSLTDGGPGTSTQVLSYLLYTLGWGHLRFGRAAALALLLAAINWLLILATLRISGLQEREI